MPCLAGRFEPRVGPIIPVDLRPCGSDAPRRSTRVFALVDTGASRTCLAAGVANEIGLSPIGMTRMVSASHAMLANQYLVDLLIAFGDGTHVCEGLMVVEYNDHGAPEFQMLLGRDVICDGVFTIGLDGHFTLSL